MPGRKQHYIQRLLLKGFAIDANREPCQVWVYRRDGKVFATSLEGYGAERDFFGHPDESDLDDRINDLEERKYNQFILGLRAAPEGTVSAEESAELAIHLLMRGKNHRMVLSDAVEPVMKRCRELMRVPSTLENLVFSGFWKEPDVILYKLGLPPFATFRRPRDIKNLKILFRRLAKDFILKKRAEIDAYLDTFNSRLRELVANGHRRMIEANLESLRGTRYQQLTHLQWFIVNLQSGGLIQGDSMLTFEIANGVFKTMSEPGDALQHVWIPISHDRMLVGTTRDIPPEIDTSRVNEGAAACSYEAFCGREGPSKHGDLVPQIRTSCYCLTPDSIEEQAREHLGKVIKL